MNKVVGISIAALPVLTTLSTLVLVMLTRLGLLRIGFLNTVLPLLMCVALASLLAGLAAAIVSRNGWWLLACVGSIVAGLIIFYVAFAVAMIGAG